MSPRAHQTLFITVTLTTFMTVGVLWMEYSFSFWWVVLGAGGVTITCELVFQYFIPARCPDCGTRVQCHVSSETHRARNSEHHEHFYRTVMIIKYHCPQCDAWVTHSQGLNTLGAMLGFFVGGMAGMAFLIGFHDALSGGLAMGLFFLCPLLGFAIGSLIGNPQRDQERLDSVTTKIFKLGPQRCAAYAFFAFAVSFWVIAAAVSIPAIRLAMAGERVEGTVAETREPQYDDGYPRVAVIRFSVGQRKVELKRSGDFQVGETLPVVYLPSDPDVAEIDTFHWLHGDWAIPAAFGCLPAIVSLFFYVASRRPSWARKDRLESSRLDVPDVICNDLAAKLRAASAANLTYAPDEFKAFTGELEGVVDGVPYHADSLFYGNVEVWIDLPQDQMRLPPLFVETRSGLSNPATAEWGAEQILALFDLGATDVDVGFHSDCIQVTFPWNRDMMTRELIEQAVTLMAALRRQALG